MTRQKHLAPGELDALFKSVRRSSWRWECQGHYAVDEPELAAWKTGQPFDETDDDRAWIAYIRQLTAAGIPFERVRLLTEPLNDYVRWILTTTDRNIEAGEDIRWLRQSDAASLGMPDYDFYLFDDERVVIMRFDERKVMTGLELDETPEVVARHREHRARAWDSAIRHHDYRSAAR